MGKSRVAIVRCPSYEQRRVDSAVRRAIEILGVEIPRNKTVLIKPNVILPKNPEHAATTHPAVVEAVCKILKERKCEIIIGESDGSGMTEIGFKNSGIGEVARKYGAKLVAFEKDKKVKVRLKSNKIVKEAFLPETVVKAEFIINLPKLKTHSLTKYTGAVKNMFGIIPGATKAMYHSIAPTEKKFSEILVDVYSLRIPELCIMDGIVGMEGMGPTQGNPKRTGLILASSDGVALDFIASRIIGIDPNQVHHIASAFMRGLSEKEEVEAVTENRVLESLEEYEVRYKRAPELNGLLSILGQKAISIFAPKPVLNRSKCTGCKVCYTHCPVNAISFEKGYPEIDRKKCIRCFCCAELCAYHAMTVEKTTPLTILKRIIGR